MAHLQQVQKQGGSSSDEMKMAYDFALDAQQRLFVMRGQLEKLQNDKAHLENTKPLWWHLLQKITTLFLESSHPIIMEKAKWLGLR